MIIAIDPGANGGIAVYDYGTITAFKMPEKIGDKYEFFNNLILSAFFNGVVYIEDVGYHRKGNNAQTSCTLARHCGELDGILTACHANVIKVSPKEWQKIFSPLPKDYYKKKQEIKKMMLERFPHLKVTLATADALGILVYALEKEK